MRYMMCQYINKYNFSTTYNISRLYLHNYRNVFIIYSQFIRMHLQNELIIVSQIKCTYVYLKKCSTFTRILGRLLQNMHILRPFKLFTRTQVRLCARSMMLLQIFAGCRAVYETA